jgi:hypothetical protein
MNDREFSDIEIFQHSGERIPLFMIGHKNCLQADYLLGPGPRLYKKRIYRAAVSQRFRNTALEVRKGTEGEGKYCNGTFDIVTVCELHLSCA